MNTPVTGLAVVIPYFQRQPGVLARSLRSVANQQPCGLPVQVFIVDDASPVPPDGEMADIGWPSWMTVKIIRRPNGGPGAARNTGLDAASHAAYVAFLDSDDEWSPDHLARAVAVLEQGFDFYFADLLQLGADISAFKRAGRINAVDHVPLKEPANCYAYVGDFFDQTLRRNVVGTPTVVISNTKLRALRFNTTFTSAGEDYLFWMDSAAAGAKISFSDQTEVICGRGVNVFAGSGWGTEGHLQRVHDEIAFKRHILNHYTLNETQILSLQGTLSTLRLSFWRDLIRRVRRRQKIPASLLGAHFKKDPKTLLGAPLHILKIIRKK